MITLRQIAFNALNTIRGGKTSDDELVGIKQIYFIIHNVRAKLIREDLMKNRSISDNIKQLLQCLEVEQVDASMCCNVEIDCDVYRTLLQIPQPIELYQKDLITKIGPNQIGARSYPIVPIERIPYLGFTPFAGINNAVYASIVNRYVFLFQPKSKNKLIKRINVEGVWTDPTALTNYTNCSGQPCYTDDSYYPISAHMIEPLTQIIIQNYLKLESQAPNDMTGNARGTTETTVNKIE